MQEVLYALLLAQPRAEVARLIPLHADVLPTTLPPAIEKGARIAILGGTLMERMQAHGWFEGMLFARFAAQCGRVRRNIRTCTRNS